MGRSASHTQRSTVVFLLTVLLVMGVVIGGVIWLVYRQTEVVQVDSFAASQERQAESSVMPLSRPAPASQGFVGSAKCAECHQEIAERYRTHSMAHSLASVQEAVRIEDYDAPPCTPPGPRVYRAELRDGRLFHHEIMLDKEGQPIYDQEVEIHYVLGSGKRGRAYLIFDHGQFYQSSLGWYSSAKKWDLSPGYKPQQHYRFSRRLGEGCFYCHVGRMTTTTAPDRFADVPFPEPAIGCERCHGPGADHVAWHERGGQADQEDPIVNPSKLDPARREDVCNQCHLQGEAVELRYGRRHTDFRPGQRIEDIWVAFVAGERIGPGGRTKAVSQVLQMRASLCFQKSQGRFGCTSCHDPHFEPPAEERVAFYRQRCNACHADQGCSLPVAERVAVSPQDSCIDCHMPRMDTEDVPHTAQTDHRVLRRPDEAIAVADTVSAILEAKVFDDAHQRLPRREVDRAKALAMLSRPEILRDPRQISYAQQLLAPLSEALQPGDLSFLDVLGDDIAALLSMARAFEMLGDDFRADACWTRVLQYDPDNEGALWGKLSRAHRLLHLEEAAGYLDRLMELTPNDPMLHGRKAHILGQLGQLRRACLSAERALELDPTLIQVRRWLVEAYEQLGETDKKNAQLDILRRMSEVLPPESISGSSP